MINTQLMTRFTRLFSQVNPWLEKKKHVDAALAKLEPQVDAAVTAIYESLAPVTQEKLDEETRLYARNAFAALLKERLNAKFAAELAAVEAITKENTMQTPRHTVSIDVLESLDTAAPVVPEDYQPNAELFIPADFKPNGELFIPEQ